MKLILFSRPKVEKEFIFGFRFLVNVRSRTVEGTPLIWALKNAIHTISSTVSTFKYQSMYKRFGSSTVTYLDTYNTEIHTYSYEVKVRTKINASSSVAK